MSEETKERVDQYANLFFKGLWLVVGYFAIDLHVRVKDMDLSIQAFLLTYTENIAELKYRVKSAEDENRAIRRELNAYKNWRSNDQPEGDN